jgi:hypothetical protein
VGVYRFQLVVIDDSENASEPAFVEVLVRDSQKPTAVIDAPDRVEFGQSFKLSGERSADLPPWQDYAIRLDDGSRSQPSSHSPN